MVVMRHIRDMLAAALILTLFAPAAARPEEAGAMALALSAAEARDWTTARQASARSGPLARALVDWQALRAGIGSFQDYLAFQRAHPDWPGMALLQRRGDETLRADLPADQIRDWLGDREPQTLQAETAFLTTLDPDQARAERARFWTETPLDPADAQAFLTLYGDELAPLHLRRATGMLDRQEWAQAEPLLPLLAASDRPLIEARIALQARRPGVDDLILALPESLRADPGLTLDRFLWRVDAKLHDGARDLMLQASTSPEALRAPPLWAQMRVDYARLAMRQGDWDLAYRLAAPHHLPPDNRHYSDLEWLAGFAALKQQAADRALVHFQHLETVVGSAISTARALYWQGRAHEALGDMDAAHDAYSRAAQLPGVYYGQLAAEKIRAVMPAAYAVPGRAAETLPDWRGSALRRNEIFRAGVWLLRAGRSDEAQRFFLHLSERVPPEDIARMGRLMIEAGAPWHGLRLSKRAADHGVIYPAAHFPLTGLETVELGLPPELVLAIARQESEFNHRVSSHVGARGLMQLMPGTARDMARALNEPFDLDRLTRDPAYNARLGAAYLAGLRDRFGSSSALIASGYNAGPGRPARWLTEFGDLRRGADPVDWVELIPFDETRNYVMRVTEALPIYRARIHGKPAPIVPSWDLTGGGLMPAPRARLTLALSSRPPARPFIGPILPEGWTPTPVSAVLATDAPSGPAPGAAVSAP